MNKQIIYFAVIILVVLTSLNSCNIPVKEKIDFADNIVVAHRGAWKQKNLPQNSIASLKHAIELKCTGSEFDVSMTADSVLVINHDKHYNGMLVEETNYADLAKIKLSNGEKLPTLKEYIKAGMDNNTTTGLVCEIKPSKSKERNLFMTKKILNLVRELHAQPYILSYISFDYDILKKIKELAPNATTQYLGGSKTPEEIKADNLSGMDYYMSIFKNHPEWIAKAKTLNLILNAWTVNNREDIEFFQGYGFNYFTTDEPEMALDMMHPENNWKLVWSDEFEGNDVNLDNWTFEIWNEGEVNNEWQKYVKDTANYKVKNGKLYITVTKTGDNAKGGYTSTRLSSQGKKEFKYGRVEFRAKMPKGRGTWPALWMLGSNINDVGWAKCGEIDIMEYVGFQPDTIHTNVHTQYQHGITDFHVATPVPTAEEDFHTYGLIWSKDKLEFYLDDPSNVINTYAPTAKTVDNWPFDQPFFMIMNFAVGGTWGGVKGVDETIWPQSMTVDYVRVYKKYEKK